VQGSLGILKRGLNKDSYVGEHKEMGNRKRKKEAKRNKHPSAPRTDCLRHLPIGPAKGSGIEPEAQNLFAQLDWELGTWSRPLLLQVSPVKSTPVGERDLHGRSPGSLEQGSKGTHL